MKNTNSGANTPKEVKEFSTRNDVIARACYSMDKERLRIAANLHWINDTKTYRLLGI